MNVFYFFVEVHVLVHIDGKVRAEWKLEGEINGLRVVATIYDWKESKPLNDVIKWHIGGHDNKCISLIKQIFVGHTVTGF